MHEKKNFCPDVVGNFSSKLLKKPSKYLRQVPSTSALPEWPEEDGLAGSDSET
jgi:hypothetical protein